MSKNVPWMELDLHLFGEGGGGADGGGAGDGVGQGADGAQGSAPEMDTRSAKRGKANPLADVVYGKQAEDAQQEAQAEQPAGQPDDAARRAAFDAFMAENKDLYEERFQQQMSRRLKGHNELKGRMEAAQPVLDTLMAKHGVSTLEELQAAIDEDESYFEDAANEAGLTVEQYKRMQQLERDNERMHQAEEHRAQREGVQRAAQQWMQQAEALKARYPDFDLQKEINDPNTGERFVSLLRSGEIGVDVAYQVVHMDELMTGAIAQAVRTTRQKTVNDIRARGMRPSENGSGGGAAGTIVKKDPSKFTKADREEISRRVARGEMIEL